MSKLSDLGYMLNEKTLERKIKWVMQDDYIISTQIGQNTISVSRHSDEDDHYFLISVSNINGITVDEEGFFRDEEIYSKISEMMVRAKRDYLQADEILDDLMLKIDRL